MQARSRPRIVLGLFLPFSEGDVIEMTDKTLDRLCALAGVESEFTDGMGRRHRVGDETKRILLAAMGIPADDEATIRRALRDEQERRRQRVLAPVQ